MLYPQSHKSFRQTDIETTTTTGTIRKKDNAPLCMFLIGNQLAGIIRSALLNTGLWLWDGVAVAEEESCKCVKVIRRSNLLKTVPVSTEISLSLGLIAVELILLANYSKLCVQHLKLKVAFISFAFMTGNTVETVPEMSDGKKERRRGEQFRLRLPNIRYGN